MGKKSIATKKILPPMNGWEDSVIKFAMGELKEKWKRAGAPKGALEELPFYLNGAISGWQALMLETALVDLRERWESNRSGTPEETFLNLDLLILKVRNAKSVKGETNG